LISHFSRNFSILTSGTSFTQQKQSDMETGE